VKSSRPLHDHLSSFAERMLLLQGDSCDASDHVETHCVPFFVQDGTGHVMVDLRGAECQLAATFEEQKYVYDLGECAQHFAARHGFTASAFVRVAKYACRRRANFGSSQRRSSV
jgi:hypothetical protein